MRAIERSIAAPILLQAGRFDKPLQCGEFRFGSNATVWLGLDEVRSTPSFGRDEVPAIWRQPAIALNRYAIAERCGSS